MVKVLVKELSLINNRLERRFLFFDRTLIGIKKEKTLNRRLPIKNWKHVNSLKRKNVST